MAGSYDSIENKQKGSSCFLIIGTTPKLHRHTNCMFHSLDMRGKVPAITSEHSREQSLPLQKHKHFPACSQALWKGMLTTLQTEQNPTASWALSWCTLPTQTAALRHSVLQIFVYQIHEGIRRGENAKFLSSAIINIGNFWLKKHAESEWTGQDVLCNSFCLFVLFYKIPGLCDTGFCFLF